MKFFPCIISIDLPQQPTFSSDFIDPYPDMVDVTRAPNDSNAAIKEGQLVFTSYQEQLNVAPLVHEIGHMLSVPTGRWYRWNALEIDFRFREPKSYAGAMRLMRAELAACAVDEVLMSRYFGGSDYQCSSLVYGPEEISERINNMCRIVKERYAPLSQEWDFDQAELGHIYTSLRRSHWDILVEWDELMSELRLLRPFFNQDIKFDLSSHLTISGLSAVHSAAPT